MTNYKCQLCNKIFNNKSNLNKHLNKKNPCNKIIICLNCNKIFTTQNNLNKHLNKKNRCISIEIQNNITNNIITTNNNINNGIVNNINIFSIYGKKYFNLFKNSLSIETLNLEELINYEPLHSQEISETLRIEKIKLQKEKIGEPFDLDYFIKEDYDFYEERDKPYNDVFIEKNKVIESVNELQNIKFYMELIEKVCFNIEYPENFIICEDEIFQKLQIKIDDTLL